MIYMPTLLMDEIQRDRKSHKIKVKKSLYYITQYTATLAFRSGSPS
jgi:hypothetical protein